MSFEKAKADLEEKGLGDHVIVLNESSATVAEAAHALGVEPASIAKTLTSNSKFPTHARLPKRCRLAPFVIRRVMPAILIPYCRRKNC